MDTKLELTDFDLLGIIKLNDVQGIEDYVTPIIRNGKIEGYLSRSKEYYNVKTMAELAFEREKLKSKLTRELSKRNYVILENMLNCSGKVYFRKLEDYILNGSDGIGEDSIIDQNVQISYHNLFDKYRQHHFCNFLHRLLNIVHYY